MSEVEKYIKSIPDFPQPGIIFRDVTSVTEDPEGMKLAIDEMDKLLEGVDYDRRSRVQRIYIWSTAGIQERQGTCSREKEGQASERDRGDVLRS